jgi:hypothetical protein
MTIRFLFPVRRTAVLATAFLSFAAISYSAFSQEKTASWPMQKTRERALLSEEEVSNVSEGEQATASLEERGKQLRDAVNIEYHKIKTMNKQPMEIDITQTVLQYVPIGTTFKDAEIVLRAAKVDLAPTPPRPVQHDNPHYDRFSVRGGYTLQNWVVGNAKFVIVLQPDAAGSPDAKVKKAFGAIVLTSL